MSQIRVVRSEVSAGFSTPFPNSPGDREVDDCPLLLLVIENSSVQSALETNLLDAGYLVATVEDQHEAVRLMFELKPDFVIDGGEVIAQPGTDLVTLERIVRRSTTPPPLP